MIYPWTPDNVFEKYLVKPYMLPLLRAMLGDKSDNLEGCKGLNKEIAAEVVRATYRAVPGIVVSPEDVMLQAVLQIHKKGNVPLIKFLESGVLQANFSLMNLRHGECRVSKRLSFNAGNQILKH